MRKSLANGLDVWACVLALPALGALLFHLVAISPYGVIANAAGLLTFMAMVLVVAVFGWLGIRLWRTNSGLSGVHL